MILTILSAYFVGMLSVLLLAIEQRRRIIKGTARIVTVKDIDLDKGFIHLRSYKRVEDGVWTFDWLPSDFVRMSVLSWLFWVVIGVIAFWLFINKQINKIDEN